MRDVAIAYKWAPLAPLYSLGQHAITRAWSMLVVSRQLARPSSVSGMESYVPPNMRFECDTTDPACSEQLGAGGSVAPRQHSVPRTTALASKWYYVTQSGVKLLLLEVLISHDAAVGDGGCNVVPWNLGFMAL
jgi:hypothetical protein